MHDHIEKLGKLQQRILRHIIECEMPENRETVSHIARSLRLAQPTVFKSVKNLKRDHYVDYGWDGDVIVTGKGAAAAILSGVYIDKMEKHVSKLDNILRDYRRCRYIKYIEGLPDGAEKHARYIYYTKYWQHDIDDDADAKIPDPHETISVVIDCLRRIAQPYNKLDHIVKKAMTYAVENNYFEHGITKRLTTDQIRKLQLYIALQHIEALRDIPTLKELVNKYGIDKDFLKNHLMSQRESINLAIKELG